MIVMLAVAPAGLPRLIDSAHIVLNTPAPSAQAGARTAATLVRGGTYHWACAQDERNVTGARTCRHGPAVA